MSLVESPGSIAHDVGTDDAAGAGPAKKASQRAVRLFVLVGCLAVLVVLYLVAVRTQIGQRIDNAATLEHHLDRTPNRDARLSSRTLLLATVLLGPFVLWFGRAQRRKLVVTVCAVGGSLLLAELLRPLLSHPNFRLDDPLYGASYPSGHAAAAMSLALALVVIADETWVRRLLVPAIPAFVAALTLATPIHRPSDLVAGFVLALGTMMAAHWVGQNAGRRSGAGSAAPGPLAWRWRAALVRLFGLTAGFLGAEQLALRAAHLTLADLGWAFPISVLALVAVSEVTVAAFRVAMARW